MTVCPMAKKSGLPMAKRFVKMGIHAFIGLSHPPATLDPLDYIPHRWEPPQLHLGHQGPFLQLV